MLAVITTWVFSPLAPTLKGCSSASSRRSATSSGPAASDSSSEMTTNSSEPPQRVAFADHSVEPGGDRLQQFVAGAVAEGVVDVLEVVEVEEERGGGGLVAARAGQHLLGAVEDQGPVRQAGERVVGGEEGEFLLAPVQFLVGALALGLEALAHPHQVELEAELQQVHRFRQRLRPDLELGAEPLQRFGHRVAPPEAAPDDLVEQRRPVDRQLAEDLPGFPPRLDRGVHALAGDPAGDGDRRVAADPFEAVADDRVDVVVELGGLPQRHFEHLVDPRLQRLAELAQVLLTLPLGQRRRQRRPRPTRALRIKIHHQSM
jgi:hypothetical protein